MKGQLGPRFWLEVALAATSGSVFVLTLFWQEWIEAIFHVEPDGGSGSLELAIVAVLLASTAVWTLLARAERRRVRGRASLSPSRP